MIVHVRDASHPELAFQAREVERVLAEDLKATPEQLSSVIQVFNKVDLVPTPERSFSEARALTTCAKSGEGVHELLQVVEARIVELSGEVVRKIRIPMVDTERLSWLHTVSDALHCKCSHPSQTRALSLSCQEKFYTFATALLRVPTTCRMQRCWTWRAALTGTSWRRQFGSNRPHIGATTQ